MLREEEQLIMKKKVLISGGSGLIGSRLSKMLLEKGYEVAHLSRTSGKKSDEIKTIVWDVENRFLNADEIAPYDYIFHLAGAGIVEKKWTEEQKKIIIESRTQTARLLKNAIAQNIQKPQAFISASAIGYYGLTTSDHIFKENEAPGNDFLADSCVKWENAVDEVAEIGIPTTKIRIGLPLSKKGGALKEMAKTVKLGFGAAFGSGKQWMPWIHIDDLCAIFIHVLENKITGTFNAAVPVESQLNNQAFTKQLAKTLKKPLWLPNVPAFVLKLILGQRAQLILTGSRIDSTKIQENGFSFEYKKLEDALGEIYGVD